MDYQKIPRYVLAAIFLVFGAMKFFSPTSGANFERWGYPAWFGFVTGGMEVSAALLLALEKTKFFGAVLGAIIMVGAAVTHLLVPEVGLLPLGIPMLIGCSWLAWKYRPMMKSAGKGQPQA